MLPIKITAWYHLFTTKGKWGDEDMPPSPRGGSEGDETYSIAVRSRPAGASPVSLWDSEIKSTRCDTHGNQEQNLARMTGRCSGVPVGLHRAKA